MMADNLVRLFEGEEELSIALADYVAQLADAAVNERGAFAIALSGGPLVRLLGSSPLLLFITLELDRVILYSYTSTVIRTYNIVFFPMNERS